MLKMVTHSYPSLPSPARSPVVNSTCSDFNHGSALHIAASNLCLGAAKCLLEHGANPALRNRKGQVPAEVVPDPMDMSLDKAEAALVAKELRTLLEEAVPLSCTLPKVTLPNYDNVPGNLMLTALGLRLGDRVLLDGQKVRGWGEERGGSSRIPPGAGCMGCRQTSLVVTPYFISSRSCYQHTPFI